MDMTMMRAIRSDVRKCANDSKKEKPKMDIAMMLAIRSDIEKCAEDNKSERKTEVANDDCFASGDVYEKIKEQLKKMLKSRAWNIKKCLACIYDLYENYAIADDQEEELYKMADPNDRFNEPSVYWNDYNGENPLMNVYLASKN